MTEQEELEMLRALVKKQQEELEKKDQGIIEKQRIQIDNMVQALLHARKKLYGPSSEATGQCSGQMSLFESMPELAKELLGEQKKITVRPYKRTARQPGIREEMLQNLPREVEEYIINPEDTCIECGGELKVIGREIVRTEVEYQPAKLIVKQIIRQVAKCMQCGKGDSPHEKEHFQKAAVPHAVLSHSLATPSLAAQVMYQKFMMGVPFNRQEKDWYRLGLVLPRSNMANWTIRCSEEWLKPVYDRIHQIQMECRYLHMDETRIRCNKEAGKKAGSESFIWVIRSGGSEAFQSVYFYYSRTRSGDIARSLLEGFHGYLTTDAYSGYEKVEGVIRNLCWAHVRRYMIESIPLDNNGKELKGSKGAEGREYINLLFRLEEEMAGMSAEERKKKRQTASRMLLDVFWTWVEKTSQMHTTNEKLTEALNYASNQRKYLETFLEDGNLPISNNLCEASIRPFATGRRAWLFADTPKGAQTNAILYTMVENARINELDAYEYLKYLLTEMPNIDFHNHPDLIDRYLPWSKELPDQCRLKRKHTKLL